jgi:hypothetical protein
MQRFAHGQVHIAVPHYQTLSFEDDSIGFAEYSNLSESCAGGGFSLESFDFCLQEDANRDSILRSTAVPPIRFRIS